MGDGIRQAETMSLAEPPRQAEPPRIEIGAHDVVHVVGGGPSLSQEPRGGTPPPAGLVLRCNGHLAPAPMHAWPWAWVSADQLAWKLVLLAPPPAHVPMIALGTAGESYRRRAAPDLAERILEAPIVLLDEWSHDLRSCWQPKPAASGLAAINLADVLTGGQGRVYLWGIDCCDEHGRRDYQPYQGWWQGLQWARTRCRSIVIGGGRHGD